MAETKKIKITPSAHSGVTFVIIRPDGTILMQLRDDGHGRKIPAPNTWVLPGGGMEKGESYIETAIREFREEFDRVLTEKDFELLMVHSGDGFTDFHTYIVHVGADFKPVLREGAALEWWGLARIKEYDLPFDQQRIVAKFEEHLNK